MTRIRLVDSGQIDRGGKPIMVEARTDHIAKAFAPLVQVEDEDVERTVANFGGTLYFRPPHFCYAEASDRFIVRGVEYEADGREADWHHQDSRHRGTVIVLRRHEVAHG
ncbi:hypothetical protein M2390_000495 [Mycetocola sp. BIGb0189]|uniref:hypothetical protein n=1 Tax=Mycetocola sp. BIGb0189 TaxID=2940604 RepID=UPI002169D9A0|nr:hypothetical protein [Mycetocola sp. BIGb0189]MCS4275334.1 hypothetical protein [Mycetocola sp. BIGb0189]